MTPHYPNPSADGLTMAIVRPRPGRDDLVAPASVGFTEGYSRCYPSGAGSVLGGRCCINSYAYVRSPEIKPASAKNMAPTSRIRQADPSEARFLTALTIRSKAHWGYSESFMTAAIPELEFRSEKFLPEFLVYVCPFGKPA